MGGYLAWGMLPLDLTSGVCREKLKRGLPRVHILGNSHTYPVDLGPKTAGCLYR
jgi:hypothetical protein